MTLSLLIAPKGGRETASSRYRVHDLIPLLVARGWDVELLTPSVATHRRLRALIRDVRLAARQRDVLLVQRPGRRREESLTLRVAARRARLVAIDVDDPMSERGLAGWAVRRAGLALVGSHTLERHYAGRVAEVVVIPTALDVEAYALPRVRHDPPIVGWIGDGPSYAEPLVRMTAAVAASGGRWALRIVGTKGADALERRLREAAGSTPLELVSAIDWESERAVARQVAEFDVGLAPLRDSKGASFKTIQYLAAGAVPLVEAGGEGEYHARAALGSGAVVVAVGMVAEVSAALARLAQPEERSRLSQLGRERARHLFSRESVSGSVDATLRRALERTRR